MKKDIIVILALVAFILIFWLPALLDLVPLLGDDVIYHHFPSKVLYASSLRQGTLPWWDPHTFCGAWPIIQRYDGGPYYLPDYPFLLLSPLSPADLAVKSLILLPMFLHYLLMAVSAYLLGRLGLGLNRVGSAVLSVAYAMSPPINYLAFAASIVPLHAWLPLLWLLLLLFIDRGGLRYVALAGCVLALQIASGGTGHLVRLWTFTAFLFFGVGLRHLVAGDWTRLLRVAAGGAAALILGLALSAPAWLGYLEGYRSLGESGVVSIESVAGGGNSLQPAYLATLLVPNLFGSVVGVRGWGVTLTVMFDQSNLLGGMLLVLLAIGGLRAARRSRPAPERFWILLGAVGVVFGVLIVLGRHTPVYRFLFNFLPNFRVPYAVRWRDFQSCSMVLLAGASASLLTRPGGVGKIFGRRMIFSYIAIVFLVILVVALLPLPNWRGRYFRFAFMQAVESGVLGEILRQLIPYLAAGLLLLLGMVVFPRRRMAILLTGVMAELVLWGWLTCYLHRDWFETEHGADPLIIRHRHFSETPLSWIVDWNPGGDEREWYRTVFYRSRFANSSWFTGGLSLFGFDCKPLLPRFYDVLRELGEEGIVYEMVLRRWDTRLPANLSASRAVVEAEQVRTGIRSPTVEDIVVPVVETDGPESRLADRPVMVMIPDALPRVFTQDRMVVSSPDEALAELINGDLRGAVFVEAGEQLAVSGEQSPLAASRLSLTEYRSYAPESEEQTVEHFNKLQAANQITDLEMNNPNRVGLTIEITRPAMLVMTDVWHPDWSVTVDGREVGLTRVNYLQRGLWLEEGRHRVMMEFVPRSWRWGRWGTIAGVLAVILILVFGGKSRGRSSAAVDR